MFKALRTNWGLINPLITNTVSASLAWVSPACRHCLLRKVIVTKFGFRRGEFRGRAVWTMSPMDVDDVPIPSPFSYSSLDKFKEKMKCASEREKWPDRIFSVGSDKEQLQNLSYSVISCLRNILSETALKNNLLTFWNSRIFASM